jgi:hypothetical protein
MSRKYQHTPTAWAETQPLILVERPGRLRRLGRAAIRLWRAFSSIVIKPTLAAGAVSAGLHFAPGLVSDPADEYLQKRGLRPDVLNTIPGNDDIRMMDRHNPLMPFYLAGQVIHASYKTSQGSRLSKIISAPFVYYGGLGSGLFLLFSSNSADAFALRGEDTAGVRTRCNIRPPGKTDANEIIATFIGHDDYKLKTKLPQEQIDKAYEQVIVDHELQHCAQKVHDMQTGIGELDSDRVALRALQASPLSGELKTFVTDSYRHARAATAVLRPAGIHTTSPGLLRPHDSSHHHYIMDRTNSAYLGLLAIGIINGKGKAYTQQTSGPSKQLYHVVKAMQRQQMIELPGARTLANDYVTAIEYFNRLAETPIISNPQLHQRLDLRGMTLPYQAGKPTF